jgi:zona occludens toxin (predicted ATPase)
MTAEARRVTASSSAFKARHLSSDIVLATANVTRGQRRRVNKKSRRAPAMD